MTGSMPSVPKEVGMRPQSACSHASTRASRSKTDRSTTRNRLIPVLSACLCASKRVSAYLVAARLTCEISVLRHPDQSH